MLVVRSKDGRHERAAAKEVLRSDFRFRNVHFRSSHNGDISATFVATDEQSFDGRAIFAGDSEQSVGTFDCCIRVNNGGDEVFYIAVGRAIQCGGDVLAFTANSVTGETAIKELASILSIPFERFCRA